MPRSARVDCLPVRLRGSVTPRAATHRLLVVARATLWRDDAEGGAWLTRVTRDGTLWPLAPPGTVGPRPWAAVALLAPGDLGRVGRGLRRALRSRRLAVPCREFLGWSLLYQRPGDAGIARVDRDDDATEVPAFYDSPLEVCDRLAFLAGRGIPCRPLALLVDDGGDVPR